MKIFTDKQFEKLLKDLEKASNRKALEKYEEGHEKGFKKGFHEGITFESEGLVFTSIGLYHFKGNESTEIKTNIKGEMTNENN